MAASIQAAQQAAQPQMPEGDPLDPEYQKKMYEAIQQKNVMENYEHALEHSPEVFGQVDMLYVDMSVNGEPVKAFIDSGAQVRSGRLPWRLLRSHNHTSLLTTTTALHTPLDPSDGCLISCTSLAGVSPSSQQFMFYDCLPVATQSCCAHVYIFHRVA